MSVHHRFATTIHNHSRVPIDQVQQREQIDPDDIDEVPIEAADFERSVIVRREPAFPCHPEKPCEDAEPDDHVQRVQASHDEVDGAVGLTVIANGSCGKFNAGLPVVSDYH